MSIHPDLIQRLNLVRSAPAFVLHEEGGDGDMSVISPSLIPSNSGVYWVAGVTSAKCRKEIESVFRVNTDDGGSLMAAMWWIGGKWYDQQDPVALSAMKLSREEMFPYDWSYLVPLEEDIYH